jgi:hypothetical protein
MPANVKIFSIFFVFVVSVVVFFALALPVLANCSPPPGGNHTVTYNCSFSGSVNGVDNGNLTINSGVTLTINAGQTIVFNPGKSVIVNGTIAMSASGAQIKKTYLWILDADNDGYAPNATSQLGQDTQPTNYQRRYTRLGTNDCYDSNANARPGQTSYFASNRGDGSFDYDCDGSVTKSSQGSNDVCSSPSYQSQYNSGCGGGSTNSCGQRLCGSYFVCASLGSSFNEACGNLFYAAACPAQCGVGPCYDFSCVQTCAAGTQIQQTCR